MKAETDNLGCPSAGNDLPALMMAGRKAGDFMTKKEFDEATLDLLVAWFLEMYKYISGSEAQKIEPLQKRQLIATAQSLLHDVQDLLENEQKAL